MSFNKIIIVGNLGRDPELSYTPQGTAVCKFSVATNERRRDKAGEQQDITTWFRVTVWGKQAENVSKYLSKGRKVYLEGRLHMEEWTDREGKPRQTLEVNASDVQFIDSAGAGGVEGIPVRSQQGAGGGGGGYGGGGGGSQSRGGGGGAGGGRPPAGGGDIEDDEIPF
ncbi:MAG TPA: single-stranded DNA-binding protein [Pyrinomonadaceae bacterium]|jgi:single-strand DNA-binding protein